RRGEAHDCHPGLRARLGPAMMEPNDKRTTLRAAIRELVRDGDALFLSGMQHGEPSAAIHEILRQGIQNLTLIPQLPDTAQLLLAGARGPPPVTAYTGPCRRGPRGTRADIVMAREPTVALCD